MHHLNRHRHGDLNTRTKLFERWQQVVYDADRTMLKPRLLLAATCLGVIALLADPLAQPLPVDYAVHLASATNYDTRSKDEDTVHASISTFVNGVRKETAIWDGKGWDGSRAEGRRWVPGLHVFGPAGMSTVQAFTGRLQDTDTLQIVFALLNAGAEPAAAIHESIAERISRTACAGGDDASAWDCLVPEAGALLEGWAAPNCDGLLAADKLVYTAMQLRRKTETGDTVTLTKNYRAANAPPGCGFSIYGAVVTIARR
jgi:hypothetical protein